MIRILYITEGRYLKTDLNTVNPIYRSKEGHIEYIKAMITACDDGYSYVWDLPNQKYIPEEFEVIYD